MKKINFTSGIPIQKPVFTFGCKSNKVNERAYLKEFMEKPSPLLNQFSGLNLVVYVQ